METKSTIKNYKVLAIENKHSNMFIRLWRLLTNPFTYIFTGKIRY